jgi:hypothetical protein
VEWRRLGMYELQRLKPMKFNSTLSTITILYILVTAYLLFRVFSSTGGEGLGPYIMLLIFQGISVLLMLILAMINNKKWLNEEYGRSSKILLLSYLVIPLLTYIMIN